MSLSSLRRRIPGKARKEMRRAEDALKRRGDAAAAEAEIRAAAELDKGAALPRSNLAAALLGERRYGEAEQAARADMRLDPQMARAAFRAAVVLEAQGRGGREALTLLHRAAREVPAASAELRRYLPEPAAPQRAAGRAVAGRYRGRTRSAYF